MGCLHDEAGRRASLSSQLVELASSCKRGLTVSTAEFLTHCTKTNCWLICLQAICERLQLDDRFLSIKSATEFHRYVTTCAQLAWSLTAQRPFYVLEYQLRGAIFDDDRHQRFHTSDPSSSVVTQVIWPALVEQTTRFCVSKAVVVT